MASTGVIYAGSTDSIEDGEEAWRNLADAEGSPDDTYAFIQVSATYTDTTVSLYNSGFIGSNYAKNDTIDPPDPAETWEYGGAANGWSASLTDTIVNSSTFGVAIQWTRSNDDLTNTAILSNYGFAIPSGATIDGVKVYVRIGPNNGGDQYPGIDSVGIEVFYTEGGGGFQAAWATQQSGRVIGGGVI